MISIRAIQTAAVIVFTAACMQSHEPGVVAVQQDDCAKCHAVEFESTAAPPHRTAGFPMSCVDCHRTIGWQPALAGLHPEAAFKVASGPHDGVKCLRCHNLDAAAPTSVKGANTDCVQCHPDSSSQRENHDGATGPQGQSYAYTTAVSNFCLTCHPAGLAAKHPDQKFPRTGPHKTPCLKCHDRSVGPDLMGMNTRCITSGCHSLSSEDSHHREEGGARYTTLRGDGSNRHFCLDSRCHPDGRAE